MRVAHAVVAVTVAGRTGRTGRVGQFEVVLAKDAAGDEAVRVGHADHALGVVLLRRLGDVVRAVDVVARGAGAFAGGAALRVVFHLACGDELVDVHQFVKDLGALGFDVGVGLVLVVGARGGFVEHGLEAFGVPEWRAEDDVVVVPDQAAVGLCECELVNVALFPGVIAQDVEMLVPGP